MKLMKSKLIKSMIIVFAAGLLLCGIGVGVAFAEIKSFEVIEGSGGEYSKSVVVNLPQGTEKIYLREYFNIIKDETVGADEFVVDFKSDDEIISAEAYIRNDLYLYNYGDRYISEHKVNYLETGFYTNDNDWNDFKETLDNIKNKKIYLDNRENKCVIRVNPSNFERIVVVPRNSEFITYGEYLDEYKYDDDRDDDWDDDWDDDKEYKRR